MQLNDTLSAIIQQNAAIHTTHALADADLPAVLVPHDYDLQNIENLLPQPARKRARFTTTLLPSFRQYCEDELTSNPRGNAACFVDNEELQAVAIFDAGSMELPEHAENIATFKLELTEEYKAAIAMHTKPMPQLDMCYWLEDWRHMIDGFTDSEDQAIEFKKAINALRKITFRAETESSHEEQDFSSQQTGLARIAATSGSVANLPSKINFVMRPSGDLQEITFQARVLIKNEAKGPSIKLQIANPEMVRQDVAEMFLHRVSDELDPLEMKSYVGKVKIG